MSRLTWTMVKVVAQAFFTSEVSFVAVRTPQPVLACHQFVPCCCEEEVDECGENVSSMSVEIKPA